MTFPLEELLKRTVNPGLKTLGFRHTGRTYRLGAKRENQCAINIQASTDAGTPGRIFYVWALVLPRAYAAFTTRNDQSGTPDDPPINLALMSNRLRAPREVSQVRVDYLGRERVEPTRWYYDDEAQSIRCGSALVQSVADLFPMLERLRTPEGVVEHFDLPHAEQGPFPEKGPMAPTTRAIILSELGQTPRLAAVIDEVRAAGHDDVADWVEARANAIDK